MEDPRYPLGRFEKPSEVDDSLRQEWISTIENCPGRLRRTVESLSDAQLDTPYRPEGWTVRQVIHHLADSHLNGYVRTKLALTEENPTFKAYMQERWAELPEARTGSLDLSLPLLDALHRRWGESLRAMSAEDWKRTIQHPAWGPISLDVNTALYAWHGAHHAAQIESLLRREGW